MKNLYKIEDELYIISEIENVNENCWIITDGKLVQVSYLLSNEVTKGYKVILTTNKLLIKDGVQSIDDEFLEWFVKNPNCDFVRTLKVPYFDESSHSYVLIIPKEEDFELVSIGEKTIKLAIPMIQDKEEVKQDTLKLKRNYL